MNSASDFWAKVDQSKGEEACWPWTGSSNQGYGWVHWRGKGSHASRVALSLQLDGNFSSKEFVCHHCDNRLCCNPKHLYLGNAATNMRDARERRRLPYGDDNWTRRRPEKLREIRARQQPQLGRERATVIKQRLLAGESPTALAREFGVHKYAIQQIGRGETYRDVEPLGPIPMRPRKRKITDEMVREIRVRLQDGERKPPIAQRYGVTLRVIYLIAHGDLYGSVT